MTDINYGIKEAIEDKVLTAILENRINPLFDEIPEFADVVPSYKVKGESIDVTIEALFRDRRSYEYTKRYSDTDTITELVNHAMNFFTFERARGSVEKYLYTHMNTLLDGIEGYIDCEFKVSFVSENKAVFLISFIVCLKENNAYCKYQGTHYTPSSTPTEKLVEIIYTCISSAIMDGRFDQCQTELSKEQIVKGSDSYNLTRSDEIHKVIYRGIDRVFERSSEYSYCSVGCSIRCIDSLITVSVIVSFNDGEKSKYYRELKMDDDIRDLVNESVSFFTSNCSKYLQANEIKLKSS